MDAGATFVAGTWDAVKASHDVALTAAALVGRRVRRFRVCRPPGHHAGPGFAGGYCYINNAAVAAEWLRVNGAARVSVLDIDYHHGNGTEAIFYARPDVQVVNIHADPMVEYPYFLGHADERGNGGRGLHPEPAAAARQRFAAWSAALDSAAGGGRLRAGRAGGLARRRHLPRRSDQPVPPRHPRLSADRRPDPRLGLPTLFVMEGGYAVEEIGVNAVGVLEGFEDR